MSDKKKTKQQWHRLSGRHSDSKCKSDFVSPDFNVHSNELNKYLKIYLYYDLIQFIFPEWIQTRPRITNWTFDLLTTTYKTLSYFKTHHVHKMKQKCKKIMFVKYYQTLY